MARARLRPRCRHFLSETNQSHATLFSLQLTKLMRIYIYQLMEYRLPPASHTSWVNMTSRLVIVRNIVVIAAVVALGVGLYVSAETNGIGRASSFEAVTAFPTVSTMPSPSPTVSPAPTLRPSSSPSNEPSISPTNEPSSIPSSSPTKSPTKAPTISPAPTMSPSSSPSAAPSAPPLPKNYNFRMKLYWRRGYQWQEESIEREVSWIKEEEYRSCENVFVPPFSPLTVQSVVVPRMHKVRALDNLRKWPWLRKKERLSSRRSVLAAKMQKEWQQCSISDYEP